MEKQIKEEQIKEKQYGNEIPKDKDFSKKTNPNRPSQTYKEDIFDKLMKLPVLRFFYPLYEKKKEVLLYLFFGGLTFVISVITYAYFNQRLHMSALVANIFSWIIAVLFAFFTNRIWVFSSPTNTFMEFAKQLVSFFTGRVFTLLVEEAILGICVDLVHLPSIPIKIAAQIIVIVLNYVISKLFIFKESKKI